MILRKLCLTQKSFLVTTLVMLISLTTMSTNIVGSGFQVKTQTLKESPFTVIDFAYGPSKADIVFSSHFAELQSHENIKAKIGGGIGNAVLGAEATGSLSLKSDRERKIYSLTLIRNIKQSCSICDIELTPELEGQRPIDWQNAQFTNRYGDALVWSANIGSELKIIIVAEYIHDSTSKEIDVEVNAKALFATITLGNFKNSHRSIEADDFGFSIYMEQKGGDKSIKEAFMAKNKIAMPGDFSQCLELMDEIYNYAFGTRPIDFAHQQNKNPYIFDIEIRSYGDKSSIAWLWM